MIEAPVSVLLKMGKVWDLDSDWSFLHFWRDGVRWLARFQGYCTVNSAERCSIDMVFPGIKKRLW